MNLLLMFIWNQQVYKWEKTCDELIYLVLIEKGYSGNWLGHFFSVSLSVIKMKGYLSSG